MVASLYLASIKFARNTLSATNYRYIIEHVHYAYLVCKVWIKSLFFNEEPQDLWVPFSGCLVKAGLSSVVKVKLGGSEDGQEVLHYLKMTSTHS